MASVMSAARDKNPDIFAARSGKKVAHHWLLKDYVGEGALLLEGGTGICRGHDPLFSDQ